MDIDAEKIDDSLEGIGRFERQMTTNESFHCEEIALMQLFESASQEEQHKLAHTLIDLAKQANLVI